MTKNEFCDVLKSNVAAMLPKEYSNTEISFETVNKIGSSYLGMSLVGNGNTPRAIVNVDKLFDAYTDGVRLIDIFQEVAKQLTMSIDLPFDPANYETVRNKLFVKLVNANAVKDLAIPRVMFADLCITFHVRVDEKASFMVQDAMLAAWNITVVQLYKDAMISAQQNRTVKIQSLTGMIFDLSGLKAEQEVDELVVTTEPSQFGAAGILYTDVLNVISKAMNGDFYIIPSSIHEVICTPAKERDPQDLLAMVRSINETVVNPEDFLSDNVYLYKEKDGEVLTIS